jgi:hypothetical protein
MDLIITGEQKRRREMNNCRRRKEGRKEGRPEEVKGKTGI